MFKGGQPNTYDDIVNKTTDENLTGENWELILNLCDKVQDEGEQGARNVIAALLKRLAHRNPNVQLYTLAVAEALSKNCAIEVHREIASRSFTQGLERLITDRTTHEKVRRRALSIIALWTAEFEKDPTLGIMEECYNNLKAKNYKFEEPNEPPPPQVDDEVRRREEEELQRVLEMSVHDKGGRGQWASYTAASSSGAGGSGSTSSLGPSAASPSSSRTQQGYAVARSSTAHAVVRSPSPKTQPFVAATPTLPTPASPSNVSQTSASTNLITRVRALHTFEPTDKGELAFEKGDIIKVVDRNYKDWWRGQLRGRTGIFPVNYVEPLPEPTPADIAKEAEQEATIFAQAANIDKLLSMLRGLDPAKDNLADNEDIQELYRSSMSLRPKIVKLIDKYNQKRAELVLMNESFIKARTIFDRMMEESLARHTGLYDPRSAYPQPAQAQARPDSLARQDFGPSGYGAYDRQGYGTFPQPATGYPTGSEGVYGGASQHPPQAYADPNAAYAQMQSVYQQPYPNQQTPSPYGQPAQSTQDPNAYAAVQQQHISQPQIQQQQQQQQQQQSQPQAQQSGRSESMGAPQPQHQAQVQGAQGPPYVYDPKMTYADQNVQAWAQYYAQGGKDPTGAVYFVSIPGVTDGQGHSPGVQNHQQQPQPAQQLQQQQQGAPAQVGGTPYQSYPGQQSSGEPAYAGSQPSFNASSGSLSSQSQPIPDAYSGPENTSLPSGHAASPQAFPPQSSPTSQQHPQPFYQAADTNTQQYPPNPYPMDQPNGYFPPTQDGVVQPPSAGHDPQAHFGAQYAQMHGQFGGMAIGDSPGGHGITQAAQTA